MKQPKVILTRSGDLVPFDISRIERAIEKAAESAKHNDMSFVDDLSNQAVSRLTEMMVENDGERTISIEDIQDVVENTLMDSEYKDIAKQFILYRAERNRERQKQREETEKKIEKNTLKVIKTNGKKQTFDREKIKETYKRVSYKLARQCRFEELEDSLKKYVVDGMKTSDITNMMIKSAIDLISVENIHWQHIAGRLAMLDIYKEASNNRGIEIKDFYKGKSYLALMKDYIDKGLYYKDFMKYYTEDQIKEAGRKMKQSTDMTYNYSTVLMYRKRYLLNPNKIIHELPQEMYMSAALFLAIPEPEENRLKTALKIYEYCSKGMISLPTPTLLNARTNYHQLSSCFKLNVDDDLRGIYHSIENMSQISKYGGGIGVYMGNVRSKGGTIRGVKGVSGGVAPWIKVINDTAIAVNQLGARAGAISVTLDVFHRDIYDFLDLQTETGDIRRKAFDVFPAVSIPDIFMKRVEENAEWTLFCPKEVKDVTGETLQDKFGDDFAAFYEKCEKNSKLELKETVSARDLFKTFLKATVETGMPYVFFRDTVNALNPNKHAGNIYSTQLCTEICQNTKAPEYIVEEVDDDGNIAVKYVPGDTVVCNLASVNLAKVNTDEMIEKVTEVTMRVLDNVITLNYYPIKEAELTAKRYRSVGLGFLGMAEFLAVNKLSYDTQEARDVVDKMMEKFAFETIKASNVLAKERGTYELYEGSEWSKGIIMGKDEAWFKANSDMADDWSALLKDMKKDGLRFAYHTAPAPNTSTAGVVGTTAAMLPIYKKYFIETNSVAPVVNVAPNLNSENFWHYKEYVNMDMNDVIDMVSVIYKWVDQSISFEWIVNPQKVSPVELYGYYLKAWKQGIKTVYYVRSMSLEVESCESCSG